MVCVNKPQSRIPVQQEHAVTWGGGCCVFIGKYHLKQPDTGQTDNASCICYACKQSEAQWDNGEPT